METDPTPSDIGLPPRIEIEGLVMRRWQPRDLHAQVAAIAESFAELHAWMPWAATPPTLAGQREFLAESAAGWPDRLGNHNFGIFADSDGALLGAIGVHERAEPGTREIGYWCHSRHTGRGVITRCARTLTDALLAPAAVTRVEIRCDAANERSAAVPQRLGYRLDRIGERPPQAPSETGRFMVWVRTTPCEG